MTLAPLTSLPAYQMETVRPCEAPPVDAAELLGGLFELLCLLDGTREAIERVGFEPEPRRGMDLLAEFVGRLVSFGDGRFDARDYPASLGEILRQYHRLAARTRDAIGPDAAAPMRLWDREPIVDLLNLAGDLMFAYFEYFTGRFADRPLAYQWVESAAVFCVDVYRTWKSFHLTENCSQGAF